MTDPTDEAEAITRAAEALGLRELAPEVYRDLLQPATREVGKNLEKVAKLIGVGLSPLDGVMWGVDKVKAVLATKVARIFEATGTTEASEPPLSIAGPLVMGMLFARDEEELQDLYAGLLASSMTESKKGDAHPSFVAIIQQLTAPEVRLLDYLAQSFPATAVIAEERHTLRGGLTATPTVHSQVANLYRLTGDGSFEFLHLDNLIRLSLLELRSGDDVEFVAAGGDSGGTWEAHNLCARWEQLCFTELGDSFVAACRPLLARPNHVPGSEA